MNPELMAAMANALEGLSEETTEQTNRQIALHAAFLLLVRRLHRAELIDLNGLIEDIQTMAALDVHAEQRAQFEGVISTLEAVDRCEPWPGP